MTRTAFIAIYCYHKSFYLAMMQILWVPRCAMCARRAAWLTGGRGSGSPGRFNVFAGFGGISLFNSLGLVIYNILSTGLPIVFYALDKDVPEQGIVSYPELYYVSQHSGHFSAARCAYWLLRGLFQALVTLAFALRTVGDAQYATAGGGRVLDMESVGIVVYVLAIFVQTANIALETHTFTWLNHLMIWMQPALLFGIFFVASAVPLLAMYEKMVWIGSQPMFWLLIPLTVVTAVGPFVLVTLASDLVRADPERVIRTACVRAQQRPAARQLRRYHRASPPAGAGVDPADASVDAARARRYGRAAAASTLSALSCGGCGDGRDDYGHRDGARDRSRRSGCAGHGRTADRAARGAVDRSDDIDDYDNDMFEEEHDAAATLLM